MPECELVNQMQSESRAIVKLLDINDMQTLLRKVKYSTRPLSGEWRWPGMKKKACESQTTKELQFMLVYSLTEESCAHISHQ